MTSRANPGLYLNALAYTALLVVGIVGAAAFVGSLASLVEPLYPVAALVAAALLLWRKPTLYLGYMWWVWFLTPEVRRVVDLSVGYTEASLVMLAPYLVTGVALGAVLMNLHRLGRAARLAFAFIAMGLLYAYAVGVLHNGPLAATFDLLNWGAPVISSAYVLTHYHHAEAFRSVVQRTFMWGLLVMGLYGLVQYFYLPAWDGYWMDNAPLFSIGISEPLEVRVFSTLNAPNPFAIVLMAGLLLTFSARGALRAFGAAAGFIGFGLSAVRAAWGGWVVGLLVISLNLPLRLRVRLLGSITFIGILIVPLFSVEPISELVGQRLETVTDLENDVSFNARLALYADLPNFIAGNLLGQGLGATGVATQLNANDNELLNLDSGIIAVLYAFGLFGTIYFVGGAFVLFIRAIALGVRSHDLTNTAYAGITVAALSQFALSNTWVGVTGMVVWFFPSLCLASHKWSSHKYDAQKDRASERTVAQVRSTPESLPRRGRV